METNETSSSKLNEIDYYLQIIDYSISFTHTHTHYNTIAFIFPHVPYLAELSPVMSSLTLTLSVFGNTNPGITLIKIIIMIITDRRGVKNLLSLLSNCHVTVMVPPIICTESMQSIFNCKKCQGAYS